MCEHVVLSGTFPLSDEFDKIATGEFDRKISLWPTGHMHIRYVCRPIVQYSTRIRFNPPLVFTRRCTQVYAAMSVVTILVDIGICDVFRVVVKDVQVFRKIRVIPRPDQGHQMNSRTKNRAQQHVRRYRQPESEILRIQVEME